MNKQDAQTDAIASFIMLLETRKAENMINHTKGPWVPEMGTKFPIVVTRDEPYITVCELLNSDMPMNVMAANATLLAAAPEMLDALNCLNKEMSEMSASGTVPIQLLTAFFKVRAAILKATGGVE